jgi:hypothetical protein
MNLGMLFISIVQFKLGFIGVSDGVWESKPDQDTPFCGLADTGYFYIYAGRA